MKVWYGIFYEEKGFWFFNPFRGKDLVKAETAQEALSKVKIPLNWRVRECFPLGKDQQFILDKMLELEELKERAHALKEIANR